MIDPTQRLVNLAMYLATARGPVSRTRIRAEVEGYDDGQDEAAFLRMFERDKDLLRDAGLAIASEPDGSYRLDSAATFAARLPLHPDEVATIRAVGYALLDDPAFPFAGELRLALAKIATALEAPDTHVVTRLADERPAEQGVGVAALDRAVSACKRVTFRYTNSLGRTAPHRVEPYGLVAREGRWYLVGRDADLDEIRVYAIFRMEGLAVATDRPKTPDFERPDGFDVARFIGLPFQYGHDAFEALLRFSPDAAWRAPALAVGSGELKTGPDGSVTWTVTTRDRERLLRWIVENGPDIAPVSPPDLAAALADALDRVASLHTAPAGSEVQS